MTSKAKIGVLGASGYTGAELVRMLLRHPAAKSCCSPPSAAPAKRCARCFRSSRPTLCRSSPARGFDGRRPISPHLLRVAARHDAEGDHGDLRRHAGDQDRRLSADFRLADTAAYAKGYGTNTMRPSCRQEAVYGLVEIHRREIKKAQLVANPGCHTTCAQLPLIPLIRPRRSTSTTSWSMPSPA